MKAGSRGYDVAATNRPQNARWNSKRQTFNEKQWFSTVPRNCLLIYILTRNLAGSGTGFLPVVLVSSHKTFNTYL